MSSSRRQWLAFSLVTGLLVALDAPATTAQRSRQMQSAVLLPANTPRFVVTAKPTAIDVGKTCDVRIELQDARGVKMNAPATMEVVLTVTSLSTLLETKQAPPFRPSTAPPASLDHQKLTLPSGQQVLQVKALFPKSQGDVDFQVTPNRLGDVRVFVEAVGSPQVQAGAALITVVRNLLQMRRHDEPDVQRIAWRPADPPDAVHLRFKDSGLDVKRQGGELVRPFFVGLERVEGGESRPALPPNGMNLTVDLSILKGRARFDRQSLVIPADSINSPTSAELRSSVGGTIEMAARSLLPDIHEARGSFTFEPGARATHLVVRALSDSALANGLDPIAVEVSAVYREGESETVMKADDEDLPERQVSFKFSGGSARLKNGDNSVVIPAGQPSRTVQVFASRPSRALTIEANSINGLRTPITGSTRVAFNLPWTQLLCAMIGGLLIPVIRRARWTPILLSVVGGGVLYVALLFGAVLTGEFNLGAIAIGLTKLPTENVLAAFVLGLVGSVALTPFLRTRA